MENWESAMEGLPWVLMAECGEVYKVSNLSNPLMEAVSEEAAISVKPQSTSIAEAQPQLEEIH